jgi:hypothetical protein
MRLRLPEKISEGIVMTECNPAEIKADQQSQTGGDCDAKDDMPGLAETE